MKRAFYMGFARPWAWRLAASAMFLAPVAAGLWGAGCSAPDTTGRVDAIGPDRAQFDLVAPVLARRCGSIDCHGSVYRNMRVYGYGGTRIADGGAVTPDPETPARTTADEAQATYNSVVGVEPEIMRTVVQAGGAGPERLTFLRKGRGDEDHKGGRLITPGDPSDRCITTWLASAVDPAACQAGACLDDAGKPSPAALCK